MAATRAVWFAIAGTLVLVLAEATIDPDTFKFYAQPFGGLRALHIPFHAASLVVSFFGAAYGFQLSRVPSIVGASALGVVYGLASIVGSLIAYLVWEIGGVLIWCFMASGVVSSYGSNLLGRWATPVDRG